MRLPKSATSKYTVKPTAVRSSLKADNSFCNLARSSVSESQQYEMKAFGRNVSFSFDQGERSFKNSRALIRTGGSIVLWITLATPALKDILA